eukprot:755956_1
MSRGNIESYHAFQERHVVVESELGFIDGLKIAAALMAKNVGGGLNYVSRLSLVRRKCECSRSLDASANAVAAGLCADNICASIDFPITSALAAGRPRWYRRRRQ